MLYTELRVLRVILGHARIVIHRLLSPLDLAVASLVAGSGEIETWSYEITISFEKEEMRELFYPMVIVFIYSRAGRAYSIAGVRDV